MCVRSYSSGERVSVSGHTTWVTLFIVHFPYYHTLPHTLPTPILLSHIVLFHTKPDTYDHRVWKTGLPVRSAVLKPHAGELVVGWVTTSESSLLYVFIPFFFVLRLSSSQCRYGILIGVS
ncbi:L-lysine 2,3-aminomutase, putative [Penicillium digitatum PHI26]|uniref:L-lysine 2,3-aminomutase, putative n=1 Tax=Penicillium digitatum (strain PHI26 / CECT 20796) TaxID=1170229 RepID=K9FSH0_PEND2|nr:L-lysine 2,3-aminomutase, putative [Penicillium digitatum PHI26]